jgi:hypothetical protein
VIKGQSIRQKRLEQRFELADCFVAFLPAMTT